MSPSNDHELEIVRIVDRIDSEGKLCLSAGAGVMAAVNFMMSKDDCKFLVGYIRWRMDNPIPK